MVFNSFGFLAFFSAVAVVYYLLPHAYRWPLLAAASLYFYAAFRPAYLPLLLGVALVAYGAAWAIERREAGMPRRAVLGIGVVVVLAPLLVFKYYDFFVRTVTGTFSGAAPDVRGLPLLNAGAVAGLSFYTFSCVSYLADVHAARIRAERQVGRFLTYVAFFPKLLAGPLERAAPFFEQLRRPVRFESAAVTAGLQLMLWGLFKKVVVADRIGVIVDAAYRQPAFSAPADLLLATYLFAFQIYCDFSGYSDIAIGSAKVLGFDLMANFRRPYFATSVREFWSGRWHLSLMAWFRDYLYIPLGGNRVSKARQCFNVMMVFLVSGLWHGANWTFVAWGMLNGFFYVALMVLTGAGRTLAPFARRAPALSSFLCRIATFHLVLVSWVFFRAATLGEAAAIFARVASSFGSLAGPLRARLTAGDLPLTIVLIAVLLAVEAIDEARPFWERVSEQPVLVRWPVYYALVFALIVLGNWNLQQFVYMQF